MKKLKKIYLWTETFNKDSNQQVEQNIVTESHEGDEVQGGPMTGLLHSVEQNYIPIFLGQYLEKWLINR